MFMSNDFSKRAKRFFKVQNSLPVHAKRHVGKSLLSLTNSHRQKRHSRLRKTSLPIENSLLVHTKHPLATIVLKLPTRPLVKYPLIFVRRRG